MSEVVIETQRLRLRGITPAIIHQVFETHTEEEIVKLFGLDEKGYLHYKDMHEQGMETNRFSLFFFLLIDKETELPIGECGFHTLNRTHKRTELFYFMRNDSYKNKGLMSEALPHVIRYGFETLELNRIEALVASWNEPSIRLLQKNKFVFEGTMRQDYVVDGVPDDSDCYSLLKSEWESNKMQIVQQA